MPSIKNSTVNTVSQTTPNAEIELKAEHIIRYLQQHPSFIDEHPQLLESLQLSHQTGNAVSLIERQVNRLRLHNTALERQLHELVTNVRNNDLLFNQTRHLVLAVVGADSLSSLVSRVEQAFVEHCAVDACVLTLFSDHADHDRLGGAHSIDNDTESTASNVVSLQESQQTLTNLLSNSGAICGSFRPQELAFLFQDQQTAVKSAAVAPLGADTMLGVLAIGSTDPDYYNSTIGTLFLDYIAEVIDLQLIRLLDLDSGDE